MTSGFNDLDRRLEVAVQAAHAAGAVHLRYYGGDVGASTKHDRFDFLTQADVESQAAAKAVIAGAFPDDVIVGEEDGLSDADLVRALDGACWTVDPLDGTQSFVHGFPVFGPGIAFVVQRQPLVGVVHLPVHGETYAAARGLGATLNGRPIHVGPSRTLHDALVGIHIRDASPPSVQRFLETTGRVLLASNGIRLLGSPMIAMAYVAAGRLDACATLSPTRLAAWDLAPGAVILSEAGGAVAGKDGGPFDILAPGVSGASSQALLGELFAAVLSDVK